jgi:hypothetical protein
MSDHEEHHQESPKKVYFGVPIAFAISFWFVVFLCLKACDGPKDCCNKEQCTKECMEKCKAEGKECKEEGEEKAEGGKTEGEEKKDAVSEEKKESAAEEKKENGEEKKAEEPAEKH